MPPPSSPAPGADGSAAARSGTLLLMCVSVLAALGMLEFGARVAIGRRPVLTTGEQGVYSRFDPLLGWRNRPGAAVRYSRRDYQTSVTINSLGFRDVEHPRGRPRGITRVLALGDSFIEAYTVELEESMTRRAEFLGRSQGCPVEVMNAGVHGYSTDQEALWYVHAAEPLAANVVLVFAYYNDVLNNVRGNYWGSPKPLTRVIDGRIVPVNLPLPNPATTGPAGIRSRVAPVVTGSALGQAVMERIVTGAPRFHAWLARAGVVGAIESEDIPDELRAYKTRGQLEEFALAWENTGAILGVLGEVIRARQAVPVLVHIPSRFEVSERDCDLTIQRYALDPKVWDRTLVRSRLREIASAQKWAFLDLAAPIGEATGALKGETYLPYDGHWNPRGQDVVARAVISFLKERGLLVCDGAAS